MSRSVDDLEAEVRSIQDDLSRDLDALAGYFPNADNIGRTLAVVAGVAVGAWVLLSWLLGMRRRARDRRTIKRAVREVLAES